MIKFKEIVDNIINEEADIGTYISDGGLWEVECFNRGERDIPHIHLKTPKGKYSAPRLDKAEYFIHDNKRYIMNSKEKKDFGNFMSSKNRLDNTITNWQACVKRWNLTQPLNKRILNNISMPDYRLL